MNLSSFLKKHWFAVLVIAILLLASVLRFYNYTNRWGLAYDQAHDILVARSALEQHKLPQLGPFSSAGPFVTGPEWYWFIMLGVILFPSAVITPWILLTLTFILFVYLMIVVGKKIGGTFFGLACGFLAAVSTANINQSINLTNQAPLALLSVLSIFSILNYFKKKNIWFLFLNGIFVSLGINTHLQGVLLIPLFILPLLFEVISIGFSKKDTVKARLTLSAKIISTSVIGFILPFIPLITFDSTHHFYDLRSMWQYYRHDQYKISLDQLGRNWKTYLSTFWPTSLANIIGGYVMIAYALIALFFVTVCYSIYKKNISKSIVIVLLAFFIAFLFMRYTRTPLFTSYLMFLHPWIFILVAWMVTLLFNRNKIIGVLLLTTIVAGSLVKDIQSMDQFNSTATQSIAWENTLTKKFPHQKFIMYDYQYKTAGYGLPLVAYLDADNLLSTNGIKIGVRVATSDAAIMFPSLSEQKSGVVLFILNSSSSAELIKNDWHRINPSDIYHATEEWNPRSL